MTKILALKFKAPRGYINFDVVGSRDLGDRLPSKNRIHLDLTSLLQAIHIVLRMLSLPWMTISAAKPNIAALSRDNQGLVTHFIDLDDPHVTQPVG